MGQVWVYNDNYKFAEMAIIGTIAQYFTFFSNLVVDRW